MTPADTEPLVINGWTIYAHSLFIDQLEALIAEVDVARERDPDNYAARNVTKRLAAVCKLAFETIPQDPARPEYRQGGTLGPKCTHWFRAKFFQQYRLFFRFSTRLKTIVLVWVNDDVSRAQGRARGCS